MLAPVEDWPVAEASVRSRPAEPPDRAKKEGPGIQRTPGRRPTLGGYLSAPDAGGGATPRAFRTADIVADVLEMADSLETAEAVRTSQTLSSLPRVPIATNSRTTSRPSRPTGATPNRS